MHQVLSGERLFVTQLLCRASHGRLERTLFWFVGVNRCKTDDVCVVGAQAGTRVTDTDGPASCRNLSLPVGSCWKI